MKYKLINKKGKIKTKITFTKKEYYKKLNEEERRGLESCVQKQETERTVFFIADGDYINAKNAEEKVMEISFTLA